MRVMKLGLTRQLGNFRVTISRGRELIGMNGVSIYIPVLGKVDSSTYPSIIPEDSNGAKQGFVGRKKYPDQDSICFN